MRTITGLSMFLTLVTGSLSGRIPIRLYVRSVGEDINDVEDASAVDSWDKISYINRPVELHKEEGCSITLESAIKSLLPEIFEDKLSIRDDLPLQGDSEAGSGMGDEEIMGIIKNARMYETYKDRIKLIRIQGIELDAHIPFYWVVNNFRNPEFYLHICVFVGSFVIRAR